MARGRAYNSRRHKAEGPTVDIQNLRAQPTIDTHTGQTTQGRTKKISINKTTSAPPKCPDTHAFLTCVCLYTVLTPAYTHVPFTETRSAYEIPLPHLVAINNPQEARHITNVTTRWMEDSDAAPHGGTETLTAKRRGAQLNRWEISPLHSKNPQEGEGSYSSLHGKLIEHSEARLQESERAAD